MYVFCFAGATMPPLQHSTMMALETEPGMKTTLLLWGGLNTNTFTTTNTAFKFTEKGQRGAGRNPHFDLTMYKAEEQDSVPTGTSHLFSIKLYFNCNYYDLYSRTFVTTSDEKKNPYNIFVIYQFLQFIVFKTIKGLFRDPDPLFILPLHTMHSTLFAILYQWDPLGS